MEGTPYRDRRVECTPEEVRLRGYYLPWGTKRIRYADIRSIERLAMSVSRGKGRVWGSGDFRHWANFDPGRPKKSVGFFLDVGRSVVPFVTPDDPDAFEAAVRSRMVPGPAGGGGPAD